MAQHSMGWDRDIGGEPIQQTVAIAKALGIRAPATSTDVVRWMLQQKLHFVVPSLGEGRLCGIGQGGGVASLVTGLLTIQ